MTWIIDNLNWLVPSFITLIVGCGYVFNIKVKKIKQKSIKSNTSIQIGEINVRKKDD